MFLLAAILHILNKILRIPKHKLEYNKKIHPYLFSILKEIFRKVSLLKSIIKNRNRIVTLQA